MDAFDSIGLNIVFWSGIHIAMPRTPSGDWIDDVLLTVAVGSATIVVALELLGLAGQINTRSVVAISVGTGLAGALVRFRTWHRAPPIASRAQAAPTSAVRWGIAAPAALSLSAWAALVYLLIGIVFPVEPISDAPIYHLPFAVQWLRSGSLDLVPTPFGDGAATYFPANGELWLTWLMASGAKASLVKIGQWPFMLVGALALFAISRRSGTGSAAAVFPAVLWVALPVTLTQSSIANIDLIWCAFYLIAVHFMLRYLDNAPMRDREALVGFALAAGLVIGAKTVGAVFVMLLVVPMVIAIVQAPRPAMHLFVMAMCVLAPSAFWFLRNISLTGNPLYPVQLSLFGQVVAEGWFPAAAMNASAYHLPVTDWRALLSRLQVVCGSVGLLLVLTGPIAGWLLARRTVSAASRRTQVTCVALAVAQCVLYWVFVPYNTQERFILPALGLALVPFAALAALWSWMPTALCALLAWQLLGVTRGPQGEWLTLARLFDNPLSFGSVWAAVWLPAGIVAAAIIVRWRGRVSVVLAGLLVATGAYVSARPAVSALTEQPLVRFYPRAGFAARMWPAWEILERHAPSSGANIAYTGTNLPYYLHGPDLRNNVEYININRHEGWLFHDYHRALLQAGAFRLSNDPYPQWYRADADFGAWLANLRLREIQFVFIARENRHGRLDPYPGALPQFPIEKRWADAHPELFDHLGPFDNTPGGIPWASVYRLRPPSVD